MTRLEFPKSVKKEALRRCGGRCEACGVRLAVAGVHFDHRIADAIGGSINLENCACLCLKCHRSKTAIHDLPRIAKMRRMHEKNLGIKRAKRPMAGSRASKFKRKMSGQIVRKEP